MSLPQLPNTLGRKPIAILDQRLTNFCTAFAYAAAAAFKLGFKVSPEFQTAMEGRIAGKPITEGATLDTMCNAGSVYGVVRDDACPIKLDAGNAATVADWTKYPDLSGLLQGFYYSAHTGKYDAYDNLRSAIYNARQAGQTAVAILATFWYPEFNDAGAHDGVIDTIPTSASIADHAYDMFDWDGDYALCQLSSGKDSGNNGVFRFHRDVINFLFANPLADSRLTDDRDLNEGSRKARIIQQLLVLYYKAIKVVQALLNASQSPKITPPGPVPPAPAEDTTHTVPESEPSKDAALDTFCKAIRDYEGGPGDLNYRNNNPGNFRCSPVGYAAEYGAVKCVANFAVFPTYAQGWTYLRRTVDNRAQAHPSWTFWDFFNDYAPSNDNNDPGKYAAFVARRCGVSVDSKVAAFVA